MPSSLPVDSWHVWYSAGMTVDVSETFESLQGESTFAGLTCFFIRLAGCNLRCRYCDTTYASGGGGPMEVADLVRAASESSAQIIEVTGGEPLLQEGFVPLAEALRDRCGRPVLVETNGSYDIGVIPRDVRAIVDVKTPGSGESARMDERNVERLRDYDEVKFVLCDRADYEWARDVVRRHDLARRCAAVLFGSAWGLAEGRDIADWIMEDKLAVRLQVQLHRLLDMR